MSDDPKPIRELPPELRHIPVEETWTDIEWTSWRHMSEGFARYGLRVHGVGNPLRAVAVREGGKPRELEPLRASDTQPVLLALERLAEQVSKRLGL